MELKTRLQNNKWAITIIFSFGIIYSLISLVNHYNLRTFALDLGLYTNALYDYARFRFNDSLAFKDVPENLLADHFDLYLPLFSPLTYLFGTYTLLIVQIAAILLGAFGVYKLVKLWSPTGCFKYAALVYFLSYYSIFSALSFDYHSNVVGAVVLPWLFYFAYTGQWLKAWFVLIFICIGKENMSIWMLFVTLGLLFQFRKNKVARLHLMGMGVFSMIYTILILGIVMPAFASTGKYPHFQYAVLGDSYKDALLYVITYPFESAELLFSNHSGDIKYDGIKTSFWKFTLLSGLLLIRKPVYLFMLIPIIGQKLFHNNPSMWGVFSQYSIELAPIMAIGTYDVIRGMKNDKWKNVLAILMVLLSIVVTGRLLDMKKDSLMDLRFQFYKKKHYVKEYDLNDVKKALLIIPKDAHVSSQSHILPQIALRDKAYYFPTVLDAEYIIVSPVESSWPLKREEFIKQIDELRASPSWDLIVDTPSVLVFKRVVD